MSNPNHPTLISSPGARGLPGILPKMSIDEALVVTRIYSLADQLPSETPPPLLTAPAPRNGGIPAPFALPPLGTFGGYCASTSQGRIPKQLGSSNRDLCENIPEIAISVGRVILQGTA